MLSSTDSYNELTIHQAGHNFLLDGMDSHDNLKQSSLVYVAKSCQNFYIPNKGKVSLPEGSFVFYPPGEQKRDYTSPKVGENYWIVFDGLEHEIFSVLRFQPYEIYSVTPSSQINECFEKIIEELVFMNRQYDVMTSSLFIQLLILLWRNCNNVPNMDNLSQNSKSNSIAIAMYMMNKQCQKNYSLEEYARMCNLSSYRFCHKFKEKIGISPMVYRKLCRLKKAQLLMRKYSSWSIEKIAESVGFDTTTYFCTAFKEYYNMTPSVYKKNLKNN